MSLALDRCEIECAGDGDPLRLAQALLKQLPDTSTSIPIEEIALALDIQAIEESSFINVEAALITNRNKSEGRIGVRAGARPTRRRYSIAHELGHFLNDKHQPTDGGAFSCSLSDLMNPFGAARHVRQEREANAFAIEVLTPRDQLAAILKPAADIDRAVRMATRFEVSKEAALRRYVELHDERLAVAFSKDRRLRYVHRPEGFPWIRLTKDDPIGDTPLSPRAGDRVTSMDEVDAETWFDRGDGHRLYAQTLLQSGGFAATLLICETRDDADDDLPRFRWDRRSL